MISSQTSCYTRLPTCTWLSRDGKILLYRSAALRARGDVTELRKIDLWFTPEETRAFLVDSMGLTLSEQNINELVVNIRGWPVGLRLAALFLRQQSKPILPAAMLGENRYIMDYMASEVLSRLPVPIQEFLIKTSLLDLLHGPLCEAVVGMTEEMASGQQILEAIWSTQICS